MFNTDIKKWGGIAALALVAILVFSGTLPNPSENSQKAAVATSQTPCGAGWVLIPGNSLLGASDFCVMQFEAQNPTWSTYVSQIVDLGVAVEPRFSVPAGFTSQKPESAYSTDGIQRTPWVYITQREAITACESIGAHLVTMAEAQTINRNVETQNVNWPYGIGQQCMYGGHVDGDPLSFVTAPTGDDQHNDPYQNMNENATSIAQSLGQCPFVLSDYTTSPATLRDNGVYSRRTLYLSTGAMLWDWSGNVGEWLAETCTNNASGYGAPATFPSDGAGNGGTYFDFNPQDHIGAAYTEWTQPYLVDYESITLGPRNPALAGSAALNSSSGVGKYWGCYTNGYAVYRGGYAFKGSNGGVFNMDASHTANFNHNYVGFRCAKAVASSVSLDANGQSSLEIYAGDQYALNWNSSSVTGCTMAYSRTDGYEPKEGYFYVTPNAAGSGTTGMTGIYTLTCVGNNNQNVSASVLITAIAPPPPPPPPSPSSCTFDGQTVESGASVIAYQSASVPSGSICVSEQRTCTNGMLSGSYSSSSCEVQPPEQSKGVIQGYKVRMPGNDPSNATIAAQTVTVSGGSSSTANPYFLTVSAGATYTVFVPLLSGYTIGYTLCVDSTTCHTNTPTLGTSANVIIPTGSGHYADLWWHYTLVTPLPTATLTANGANDVTINAGEYVTLNWSSTNAA
ncbi:MAG: hypothetical protein A2854_00715, partial [Parcubacteria group bacterium RIFCSPHIGHO2_01_FULL_56_18]